MNKIFASRLESLRKDMTQKEFALSIGIALSSYTNWINGKNLPVLPVLHTICLKLGVSSDYLLGLTDDPTPAQNRPNSGNVSISANSGTVSHIATNGGTVTHTATPSTTPDPATLADLSARLATLEQIVLKLASK